MNLTDKQIKDLRQILSIQGNHGNWDYDAYMHGMFNGMEIMMAIIENREPKFRVAPDTWLDTIDTSHISSESVADLSRQQPNKEETQA